MPLDIMRRKRAVLAMQNLRRSPEFAQFDAEIGGQTRDVRDSLAASDHNAS